MVVGKPAVHFEEQLGSDSQFSFSQNAAEDRAGGAVSGVGHHFDAARKLELRGDLIHVGRTRCRMFDAMPAPVSKSPLLNQPENLLNLFAVDRALAVHHLESVIIGRIVAAGDHHAAVGLQMEYGIIEQRRGNHAEIGHVAAGGEQPGEQGVVEAVGTQTAIPRQIDFRAFLRQQYVPRARPRSRTSGSGSSWSAMPRISYSRKIVGFSIHCAV